MKDFFQEKEGTKKFAWNLKYERIAFVLCLGLLAAYLAVKSDYAGIREQGGSTKVYTINKLTGRVCETVFEVRDDPSRTCL